ncbi:PREDICTED: carbonic anhydrase 1-like [Habropoda laboriosa]|uniref:carbonic anhydrase 1-like n=1 Tax=Habropoda laboriosa TaxID=597456 RepID=UPI00083DE0DD|nr:PREDICTED: carbonic anhydrase 1-like [Habropoda laboriosa]
MEIHETVAQNVELIRNLGNTDGLLETPINLDISYMKVIELGPLEWTNIDIVPRKLKITNTGYTVILSAKWQQENHYISGGPFTGNYAFSHIHFHWGENEMNGSEHAVDGASMPMELHAVYFKDEYETLESALRRPNGITILVYFFKLQAGPNQFLEEIIKNLAVIRTAHSSVRIVPLNLSNILRPFTQDYFLYWGSIITIRNVYSILWITSREPIGISTEQVAEFRTLNDEKEAPILSNIRPLKEKQERNIFHVCPSGTTYASLLPIPRDLPSNQTDRSNNIKNVGNTPDA